MAADEHQQLLFLVRIGAHAVVALQRDHADRLAADGQRHAQPAFRRRALDHGAALALQAQHLVLVEQYRRLLGQHPFGQAVGHRPRLHRGVVVAAFVDVVGEAQRFAVVLDERDVDVLGLQQLRHDAVHGRIELLQRLALAGQPGDVEQRRLDHLGTLALLDLLAQLGGAFADFALQLGGLRAAGQRLADVLGHERQQGQVGLRIAAVRAVALHHHAADHRSVVQHRDAQPVDALRAGGQVADQAEALGQRGRAVPGVLPGLEHGQGDAVRQQLFVPLDFRVDRFLVQAVGVVQETHRALAFVEVGDEEVLGVHQAGDDGVQFAVQHARVMLVVGQVADVEQRLLQLLGLLQLLAQLRFDAGEQQDMQPRGRLPQQAADRVGLHRVGIFGLHVEDEVAVAVARNTHRTFAPAVEVVAGVAFHRRHDAHVHHRMRLVSEHVLMRRRQMPEATRLRGSADGGQLQAQPLGRRLQIGGPVKSLIVLRITPRVGHCDSQTFPLRSILAVARHRR